MGNASGTANSASTITPNTLNAITGVLNSTQSAAPNSYPPPQQHPQDPNNPAYLASASDAASTAANGLFLLSQAHQELTKREEAQARAGNTNGAPVQQNGKRGSTLKRKSYDASSPPLSELAPSSAPAKGSKRTRAGGRRKESERGGSEGMDDDDIEEGEDADLEDFENPPPTSARKAPKKPETEEEKRRNFLERNRQGDF
jgi:ATF/CREB family transcription factor